MLVAEDDEPMRTMLVDTLRAEGFEVLEATNGRELFWQIGSATVGRPLDLIVSDIRMPGYNGLEVAEAWAEVNGPRVILMTAFSNAEVRRRVAQLGIMLLDKPFDLGHLVHVVHELLGPGAGLPSPAVSGNGEGS